MWEFYHLYYRLLYFTITKEGGAKDFSERHLKVPNNQSLYSRVTHSSIQSGKNPIKIDEETLRVKGNSCVP